MIAMQSGSKQPKRELRQHQSCAMQPGELRPRSVCTAVPSNCQSCEPYGSPQEPPSCLRLHSQVQGPAVAFGSPTHSCDHPSKPQPKKSVHPLPHMPKQSSPMCGSSFANTFVGLEPFPAAAAASA